MKLTCLQTENRRFYEVEIYNLKNEDDPFPCFVEWYSTKKEVIIACKAYLKSRNLNKDDCDISIFLFDRYGFPQYPIKFD